MGVPDERLYEYALVRYMPRPERGEFINIGLLMMCKRKKWIKTEIYLPEEKIRMLAPDVNMDVLKHQAALFLRADVPEAHLPVEEKYRWLSAVKSAAIRVSPSHPGLIMSHPEEAIDNVTLENEFHRLFSLLVK